MRKLSRETPEVQRISRIESRIDGGASVPAVRGAAGIAAHLRQAILDGAYLYGEKLPAERQLAAALPFRR